MNAVNRLFYLFLFIMAAVDAPSWATDEEAFSETQKPTARTLPVSDCALKAYAVLAACMEEGCPEGVTPKEALKAVKFLGKPKYDAVRAKASDEKVQELRVRFASRDHHHTDIVTTIAEAAFSTSDPHVVYRVIAGLGFGHWTQNKIRGTAKGQELRELNFAQFAFVRARE